MHLRDSGQGWLTGPLVPVFALVLLALVIVGCSAFDREAAGGSDAKADVQYSLRHQAQAEELRTLLAGDPSLFASADQYAIGRLEYLDGIDLVVDATVVSIEGPPVEIVEGFSLYDDELGIPTAVVGDLTVERDYRSAVLDLESPMRIEFSSGSVRVGGRYQFFLLKGPSSDNYFAQFMVDLDSGVPSPGVLRPDDNADRALSALGKQLPENAAVKASATRGEVVLAIADEFFGRRQDPMSDTPILDSLEYQGGSGRQPASTGDLYPSLISPEEAADAGLVPIEVLVLEDPQHPSSSFYSFRGRKDLDSWAQVHDSLHYAVIAGYVEPGDSVQLLSKGSMNGPAEPLASLGVKGNKLNLPTEIGTGGIGVVVDLRVEADQVVRIFDNRADYSEALDSMMHLLNAATDGPEPSDSDNNQEMEPAGGSGPTTTIDGAGD